MSLQNVNTESMFPVSLCNICSRRLDSTTSDLTGPAWFDSETELCVIITR